jgi:hypothetical protein
LITCTTFVKGRGFNWLPLNVQRELLQGKPRRQGITAKDAPTRCWSMLETTMETQHAA